MNRSSQAARRAGVQPTRKARAASRRAFQELVLRLSTRAGNWPLTGVNEGVTEALRELGSFARVDRCYLFRFSEDGAEVSNTHEWCADGVDPQIEHLQNVPVTLCPWFTENLRSGRVVYVPNVETLPPEAAAERAFLAEQQIQSLISIPLIYGEEALGFLGFDAVRVLRLWNAEDIRLLRIVAEILIGALERDRMERERRQLEALLIRSHKLESLGLLAGGVAHDFNNMLTGLLGHASLAGKKISEEHPAHTHLQKVISIATGGAAIVRQLQTFTGKGNIRGESVDLFGLAEEVSGWLSPSHPATTVEVVSEGACPLIHGDRGQLQQVITNLIVNAFQAVDSGGSVRIACGSSRLSRAQLAEFAGSDTAVPGTYGVLEITDTGCGMSEDVVARIFDPFFTTKATGTGLGLSTTLGIIRAHHGGLQVKSEPGKGSTFRVVLPEAASIRAAAA